MEQTLNTIADNGVLVGDKNVASSEILIEEIIALVSHIRAVHKEGASNLQNLVACIARFESQLNIPRSQINRKSHVDQVLDRANTVWAAALTLIRNRDQRDMDVIVKYGLVLSELQQKIQAVTDCVVNKSTDEAMQEAMFNLTSTMTYAKEQMGLQPSERTAGKSVVQEASELATYVSGESDKVQARRNSLKTIPSPESTTLKDDTSMNTQTATRPAAQTQTAVASAAAKVASPEVPTPGIHPASKVVVYSELVSLRRRMTAAEASLATTGSNTDMVAIIAEMSARFNLTSDGTMDVIAGGYSQFLNTLIAKYAVEHPDVMPASAVAGGAGGGSVDVSIDAGAHEPFAYDMVSLMGQHWANSMQLSIIADPEGYVDNGELHPSLVDTAESIAAAALAGLPGTDGRRLIAMTADGPLYMEDPAHPIQMIEKPIHITQTTKVLGGVAIALGVAAIAGAGYGIYRLATRNNNGNLPDGEGAGVALN